MLPVIGISVQVCCVCLQEEKIDEKKERKKSNVSISRKQSSKQVVRTESIKRLSTSDIPEQPESKEIKPE